MSRILGTVNALGEKTASEGGADFQAAPIEDGQAGSYEVKFDKSFDSAPITLVNPVNAAQNTTCRVTPKTDGLQVYITQDLGNGPVPTDASFSFAAWGQFAQ